LSSYIHSLAGRCAADEKSHLSLTASDVIDKLPLTIKKLISTTQNYQEDLDVCLF
jgi:NAD(P)H-hydrate repair Nnr-like enzyme with NAD(P)H-hydrate dehydratase domain